MVTVKRGVVNTLMCCGMPFAYNLPILRLIVYVLAQGATLLTRLFSQTAMVLFLTRVSIGVGTQSRVQVR